jgi:hypothetical protein
VESLHKVVIILRRGKLQKPFRVRAPLFIRVFHNRSRLIGPRRSSDVLDGLNLAFLDPAHGNPEEEREANQG